MLKFTIYSIVVLQFADLLTTYLAIRWGGYEASPVLVRLDELMRRFTNAKWAWLVAAKGAAVFIIDGAYAMGWMDGQNDGLVMGALAIFYAALIAHNAWVCILME